MPVIYLDNCCYNRPFDERSNIKNYLEREAVLLIMQMAYEGKSRVPGFRIVGSDVLLKEMRMIPDIEKRRDIELLYRAVISDEIKLNDRIADRAKQIMQQSSIRAFDSLHLASAEVGADVLLTTDIKFMKAANRMGTSIRVLNPVSFILEGNEIECYN